LKVAEPPAGRLALGGTDGGPLGLALALRLALGLGAGPVLWHVAEPPSVKVPTAGSKFHE
jgi:hypothetical protein